MKLRRYFLATTIILLICMPLFAQGQTKGNISGYTVHIVEPKETLYSIAVKYNTSVTEIQKINQQIVDYQIKDGDRILIPQTGQNTTAQLQKNGFITHTIQSGETLYSISKYYNSTVSDLCMANPGLKPENAKAGTSITIPVKVTPTKSTVNASDQPQAQTIGHKVLQGETLYSLSRKYNVTISDLYKLNANLANGLQAGTTLYVPLTKDNQQIALSEPKYSAQNLNIQYNNSDYSFKSHNSILKIAVLFPFLEGSRTVPKEKLAEYYRGFLLSVLKLKQMGQSIIVYTFDSGDENSSTKLNDILQTNELQNTDLILGGTSPTQIKMLSDFSKRNNIAYAVPFSLNKETVSNNPNEVELAASIHDQYSTINLNFISRFAKYNILFTTDNNKADKADFVYYLKKDLDFNKIKYTTLAPDENLNAYISRLKKNSKTIIVPSSSSELTLQNILSQIKVLSPYHPASLFGYPEWQVYTTELYELSQHDSYIYSTFFIDNQDSTVQQQTDKYRFWYNLDLINSYPKYGFLGFDTGMYLMSALKNKKLDFSDVNYVPCQFAYKFRRIGNNGGYVNEGIYFIHFKNDLSIEKLILAK